MTNLAFHFTDGSTLLIDDVAPDMLNGLLAALDKPRGVLDVTNHATGERTLCPIANIVRVEVRS